MTPHDLISILSSMDVSRLTLIQYGAAPMTLWLDLSSHRLCGRIHWFKLGRFTITWFVARACRPLAPEVQP